MSRCASASIRCSTRSARTESIRDESGRIVDFEIVHVNQPACLDVATPCEEQIGRRLCELFPAIRTSGYFEKYKAVVDTGVPLIEDAFERGGRFWDMRVSRLADGFVAIWRDVTERIKLERELQQSNEMLRAVVETSAAAIFVKDTAGRYMMVNPVAARTLSSVGPVVGRTDAEILGPEIGDPLRATDLEAFASDGEVTCEELVVVNGNPHTFLTAKTVLRRADGEVYGVCGVATDITSRIQIERALRASEERARSRAEELAALMDVTPAAVWISTDPECHTIKGSRLAHEMLRMSNVDNLSVTPPPGVPAPRHFVVREGGVDVAPHQLAMQRAARGDELRGVEQEVVFDDGQRVWLCGSAVPLRQPDGTPRGAIAAFIDITAQKRIEQELRLAATEREGLLATAQEARAIAEAASQSKDQFLATISHELRTPLTAVLGYLQMLLQGAVSPERQQRVLETINRNAKLQLQLIDDILDVSGIIRGKVVLNSQRVDVNSIVASAIDSAMPAADAKQVQLTHDIGTLAAPAEGDPRRLHQVFSNVLANAIKFTPNQGRVHVRMWTDERHHAVEISDSGIGIAPEFLPHIFDAFAQAESGPTRRYGGLGLGLNIAHFLIARHGGTITADSGGAGRGATFRIELPRA